MARPGHFRLPARLDRADVPVIVGRSVEASRPAAVVTCDAGPVTAACLPAVDAIARIALAVRRDGRSFRLEHASPELMELLDLCGLIDCLAIAEEEARRPS